MIPAVPGTHSISNKYTGTRTSRGAFRRCRWGWTHWLRCRQCQQGLLRESEVFHFLPHGRFPIRSVRSIGKAPASSFRRRRLRTTFRAPNRRGGARAAARGPTPGRTKAVQAPAVHGRQIQYGLLHESQTPHLLAHRNTSLLFSPRVPRRETWHVDRCPSSMSRGTPSKPTRYNRRRKTNR